ncbi:MAG: biotin/lipoyl-containing protein, partial [Gemmatimonadota bacterium]
MPTKVVMEALSPTMEEGRLVEWKKAEGDPVATGDVLAEVETDKAVMELVARADGILLKQVVAAGDTVPVADPVGWIGKAGESIPGSPTTPTPDVGAQHVAPVAGPTTDPNVGAQHAAPMPATTPTPDVGAQHVAPVHGDRVKASPVARRIAGDRGLDLAAISGSGPEGRIIKRDVDAAVARPAARTQAPPAGAPGAG